MEKINKITLDDVLSVAINYTIFNVLTLKQMKETLVRYEDEQRDDPSTTWNLVVEKILYDLLSTIHPVEQAKETLKKAGYYVDNLWTVHDVDYKCTDAVKQQILNAALTNEATQEQVIFAISLEVGERNLTQEI